jgi:hypothetical protein
VHLVVRDAVLKQRRTARELLGVVSPARTAAKGFLRAFGIRREGEQGGIWFCQNVA